ncbi:MAG TPA: hypothetical protein ACFYD6_00180 [Candidatus Brocadiia bacterium]|nr:hypothetical protein [Candidatus Brocadiales bacterium]
MKRFYLLITAMCLMISIGVSGCMSSAYISQKRIVKSKEYTTAEEQVKYLIGEANSLIKMEEYDASINIAQYILQDLDPNSAEANDVIKTAKAGQEEAAKYRARYYNYPYGYGGFYSRGFLYHGRHHHGFHHHGGHHHGMHHHGSGGFCARR